MDRIITDTFIIRNGLAYSMQSCVVPALPSGGLEEYGESYFYWLERLPGAVVARGPGGERIVTSALTGRVALRFAPPYVAAAHGGRELRYPIAGGDMAMRPGGWLSFGWSEEQRAGAPSSIGACARFRLWVEVAEYAPRLGTGWLYCNTQARLHSWVTVGFLRWWAER